MKKLTQEALSENRDRYVVIDVRSSAEFEAGHVDGALHIPLDELEGRIRDLPVDKVPVAVCNLGGRKSEEAAKKLHELGRADGIALEGGTAAWRGKGG
ncbi:rhodanese-like domain-containing protein [Pseudogemmobacter bohemicus]|uniref:rhodanese-like domain-containing protein n=1 Tax=Pseudogemmobacter bohemicus TaxID=2250708 RepID=UPI000DD346DC|nr:rhodanese-like domain-containing protein [Pseudogemmobacter bohemicus]